MAVHQITGQRGCLAGDAMLSKHDTDRLDTPSQAVGFPTVLMLLDKVHDYIPGRSSSAARKADAALRIELARRSSAFSRFSFLTSADSSLDIPTRVPASTSACWTQLRIVSPVPTPNSSAIFSTAAVSDG